MIKKLFAVLSGLGISLFLPALALAGGGPIFLEVQSYQPFSESRSYTVTTHISPTIQFDYNCKDISVTFSLENPQPGDVISAGDFNSKNPTGIIEGYGRRDYKGQAKKDCNISAKVTSGTANERYVYVVADLPKYGTTKSGGAALYFGDDQLSKQVQNKTYQMMSLPWEDELPDFYNDDLPPGPSITVTYDGPKPIQVNPEVSELESRVNSLQQQLDQSLQRQSFLEQKLDSILGWLKSIFPFFK